jgi:hypothetical protein
MIVIVNGLLGILTGGAMIALAMNTSEADTVGILLMLLGLGLAGLGWLGRKKIPIGGRYLALGMKEVKLRTSRGIPVSATRAGVPGFHRPLQGEVACFRELLTEKEGGFHVSDLWM